jgi:hypothetical protein
VHYNQPRPRRVLNLRPPKALRRHYRSHDGEDTTPQRPLRADKRVWAGGMKITSKPKTPAGQNL